jgi:hypothetical protein
MGSFWELTGGVQEEDLRSSNLLVKLDIERKWGYNFEDCRHPTSLSHYLDAKLTWQRIGLDTIILEGGLHQESIYSFCYKTRAHSLICACKFNFLWFIVN